MSRFVIAATLATTLITSVFTSATAGAQRFAAPPPESPAVAPAPTDISATMPHEAAQIRMVMDRATVRAKLVEQRAANLARFRAYQQAGVFPSNTYDHRKLNVWMDEQGHICAAATIISASGHADLVDQVAEQSNFIRLGDVKQGPLMDWILTSGLTQAEIAAIQEPFMPVYRQDPEIDPKLRMAEDARLLRKYKQVEAMIAKNQKQSLDSATDRLMKRQDLAWQLVNG
jgi:hypothetical protein